MSNSTTSIPDSSGRLVLVARMLLLVVVGVLAATSLFVATRGERAVQAEEPYVCPMHPEVRAREPAECPICRMELERVGSKPATSAPRAVVASAVPKASGEAYVCPMHPEVQSASPGRCPSCKMSLERQPGKAEASAPKPESNPQYGPGVLWLPATFPASHALPTEHTPTVAVMERRTFVEPVRASAWIEAPDRVVALLYRDQLIGLSPDEPGTFYRARAPREPIAVRLTEDATTAWDASTVHVRFSVQPVEPEPEPAALAEAGAARDSEAPQAAPLPTGEVGWLELPPKPRELLTFPQSALLRSKEGAYVLVPKADHETFSRRMVQIGQILRGHVVVLSGLSEGESVVVGNAFFLNAAEGLVDRGRPLAEGAR